MMTGQQKFTEDAMIDCILLNDLIMNRTGPSKLGWEMRDERWHTIRREMS